MERKKGYLLVLKTKTLRGEGDIWHCHHYSALEAVEAYEYR